MPRRFATGVATFADPRGPLLRGSWDAYHCRARFDASRRFFVIIPLEARDPIVSFLASAMALTFKFVCKGAGARSQQVPETDPQPWQLNTVPDNVVFTRVAGVLGNDSVGWPPFGVRGW